MLKSYEISLKPRIITSRPRKPTIIQSDFIIRKENL